MPSSTERTISYHYEATQSIPADQFIPRFLSKDALEKTKNHGDIGVKAFGCDDYGRFSPYLMMSDITVKWPLMFPDHPHCGHEMMLYVLDDFTGWKETFKPGDVHWMTTGKGIIHAQVPGTGVYNRHVQFWINVPKEKKYVDPSNQVLRAENIPLIKTENAELRLLAGKYENKEAPIKTMTPLLMLDIKLHSSKSISLKLPGEFFVGIYTIEGKGLIGGQAVKNNSVTLSKAGPPGETTLKIKSDESLRFLLFAGTPITEPVNVDGFFVCCSKEETRKAVLDFEERTNTFAAGKTWSSKIINEQNQRTM